MGHFIDGTALNSRLDVPIVIITTMTYINVRNVCFMDVIYVHITKYVWTT